MVLGRRAGHAEGELMAEGGFGWPIFCWLCVDLNCKMVL